MIEAFTAADVRAAEEPLLATERGFAGGLMHRAATALATTVRAALRERTGGVVGRGVVGLVGPGSNGGDVLHALALLRRHGVEVLAVLTGRAHEGGLAALRAAGGRVVAVADDAPGAPVWLGDAVAEAFAADVVLDGLLGTGARGGLRGTAARLVELLAGLLDGAPGEAVARPLVVAVDLPSGVGVDDGTVPGPVLPAARTVTFGAVKPCLLLPPAALLAGRVDVVDLGLDAVLDDLDRSPAVRRLGPDDAAARWPVPPRAGHKYSRGVVGVVAGTPTYPGAAVLAVAGAQRAGCGMVRYVGPRAVAEQVLAAHPEVVAGRDVDVRVQAWVVGPGVADDDEQRARAVAVLDAHVRTGVPVVVDAGALDLLPDRMRPTAVLTPHAGELARLLAGRGHDVGRAAAEAEPLRWATEAQRATGATVLLKGPVTLVVGPDERVAQADAPAWLATAGAGDVLAGVLGAVLAGHVAGSPERQADPSGVPVGTGPDDATVAALAATAALVHGRAAHHAQPGGPVTAGAVARALPGAVAELLR